MLDWKEHRWEIEQSNHDRQLADMSPLPRLAISFSGGRTSAVMTHKVWEAKRHTHDILILFANTGQEHPATLDFVHQCQATFGWPVVWLEALIDPTPGKGVRHQYTDYENADREGKIFHEAVKKYGIFNPTKKSCTARLKTDVIKSFLVSQGWPFGKRLNHHTCVGIRADEADRLSLSSMRELGVVYPLIHEWPMTKRDVAIYIRSYFPFDLQIPGDHYGNCTWCYKKSKRKLYTLALENPRLFDFPRKMEQLHGRDTAHQACSDENGDTWWFRGHKSVDQIIQEAHEWKQSDKYRPYTDDPFEHAHDFDPDLDTGGSCGDSCEIGADYELDEVDP